MTLRNKQQKFGERLRETGRVVEKSVRDIVEKSTESTVGKGVERQIKNLQANLEKAFKLTMVGLNVATRDQIEFLNKRIELLNERLEKFAGKEGDTKKKKKGKIKRPK